MSDNTHVPDKLEGYMLQVRHALYELICLDERVVSVEAYDDVAVEKEGLLIAEQTKSVLSNNNPVTDRSEVFWKTIYNWCNYFTQGQYPPKVVLKYVVVSSHSIKAGTIPKLFAEAKTETEATEALESARIILFGDTKSKEKPRPISQTIEPYIEYCFAPKNKETVIKVISLMEIDIHEDTYDQELFNKFKMQSIPLEYATELFESMLGWVSDQVHQQTKQNKPAYISSKDYKTALDSQIRSRDQKIILSAVSVQPEASQTTAEVERHDTYIKQLELIDVDESDIFEAASDFLRTRSEKTAWAKKGLINGGSFADYYDGLKRLWKNQKLLSSVVVNGDIERGKYLYGQCLSNAISHRLLGRDVPSFFGSGSLQALANEPSDRPTIGWHPRYLELLKGDDKGDK